MYRSISGISSESVKGSALTDCAPLISYSDSSFVIFGRTHDTYDCEASGIALSMVSFIYLQNGGTIYMPDKIKADTIAGAYTSPAQFKTYESAFYNAVFINMYGMTETCAAYCLTRPGDSDYVRHHTVGRPIPGVELAV